MRRVRSFFCHFRRFFSAVALGSLSFKLPCTIVAPFARHVARDFAQASFIYPGKEDHPHQVNFSERLYEKQVDRSSQFNRAGACSDCLHRVEPAGRGKVFVWRKIGPRTRRVTPQSKGVNPAKPGHPSSRAKSWFAQGSSSRRMTLQPRKLFSL